VIAELLSGERWRNPGAIRAIKRPYSNILSTLCWVIKKKENKPQNASSCFIEPSLEATVLQTFCLHCGRPVGTRPTLRREKATKLRTEERSKRALLGQQAPRVAVAHLGHQCVSHMNDIAGNAPLSMHVPGAHWWPAELTLRNLCAVWGAPSARLSFCGATWNLRIVRTSQLARLLTGNQ
jgi:hypothetical protein